LPGRTDALKAPRAANAAAPQLAMPGDAKGDWTEF
jgi:hypothetical protein